MAFEADTNLDGMPEDVRREYDAIRSRLDANFIQSPDPIYSKEWVNGALAKLNRAPEYFGGLVTEDRIAVRNTILASLITEAFAARKERDPSEDDKTSWHLAVKRGVEGYLAYDAARLADMDRGAADAWGAIGQHFYESLGAGREDIFTSEDWAALKKKDRENSTTNFDRHVEEEASRTRRSDKETAVVLDEPTIREKGIARQPVMRQDPMEILGLTVLQQKLERARPSAEVFERFRAKANIADAVTWDSLTPDQKWGFSLVASADIYGEQLALHETAKAVRPEGMSDADFVAARRERAASDAEVYYTTGIRPQIGAASNPAQRDPFAETTAETMLKSPRAVDGAGDAGDTPGSAGKGLPVWMASYEKAIADAGKSGTFQSESDAVRARFKDPQSDVDRFLASVMSARTKGGEQLDFNAVTWKGRNQQSAAYGAFWLSHGLLTKAAATGLGTPPRQCTVEAIVASPELQYQAAREHVRELLESKLANGKSIAELPPEERAAALATAYRFGLERVNEAYARGKDARRARGDHWTVAVAAPVRMELAPVSAPQDAAVPAKKESPGVVAPLESFTIPVPSTAESARFLDAARQRAAGDGLTLSDAQLGDRARLEGFYRSVLEKVTGITEPSEIAALEKLVPGLKRVTDGSVSMSMIELVASNGAVTLDPSMREMLARQIGLDADPKTGKLPDVVELLRTKAAEAKLASGNNGPARTAGAEKTAVLEAGGKAASSSATVLANVIADLKRDAGTTGKNADFNLKVVGALEQWLSQPAIGARAAEIAEKLGNLSGPALRQRAIEVATATEAPAGVEGFVPFKDVLRRLEEGMAPKAASEPEQTDGPVSVNATPTRTVHNGLSLGV